MLSVTTGPEEVTEVKQLCHSEVMLIFMHFILLAGYYYSKASSPDQANTFVINFPGGGQCYDKQTCTTRSKDLSSSVGASSTIEVGGLLDSDPSATPLWGANKAYLLYCSSDGYMGNVGASEVRMKATYILIS